MTWCQIKLLLWSRLKVKHQVIAVLQYIRSSEQIRARSQMTKALKDLLWDTTTIMKILDATNQTYGITLIDDVWVQICYYAVEFRPIEVAWIEHMQIHRDEKTRRLSFTPDQKSIREYHRWYKEQERRKAKRLNVNTCVIV